MQAFNYIETQYNNVTRHPLAFEPMPDYARDIDLSPIFKVVRATGRPFISFDIESTTYVHASGFGITEIGLFHMNTDGECSSASTLLKCGLSIQPEVIKKTGISNKDLLFAPSFPSIYKRLRGLFERATVTGYYSNQFDIPGVQKECLKYHLEPINFHKTIDVARLTKYLSSRSKSNKLTSVAASLGIEPVGKAHRALYDAILSTAVAAKIINIIGVKEFISNENKPKNKTT